MISSAFAYPVVQSFAEVSLSPEAILDRGTGLGDCAYIIFADGANDYDNICDNDSPSLSSTSIHAGPTEPFNLMIVLVGSETCANADYYHEHYSQYAITCSGSSGGNPNETRLYMLEFDYLWLRDFGWNVLFVLPDFDMVPQERNGVEMKNGGGVAWYREDFAYAWKFKYIVDHEILHLKENTLCTSDGEHDKDYFCGYKHLSLL